MVTKINRDQAITKIKKDLIRTQLELISCQNRIRELVGHTEKTLNMVEDLTSNFRKEFS